MGLQNTDIKRLNDHHIYLDSKYSDQTVGMVYFHTVQLIYNDMLFVS